jgi:hexosaminidase
MAVLFQSPYRAIAFVLFVWVCACGEQVQAVAARTAIIPMPASLEMQDGAFSVGKNVEVLVEGNGEGIARVANVLASELSGATGRNVAVRDAKGVGRGGRIILSLDPGAVLGPEGYDLMIEPAGIRLHAASSAGLFSGVQTLRQMLPPVTPDDSTPATGGRISLPCMRIHDEPRFRWRGLMLDCSRTFLPLEYLKRSVDRMALYKLNVLHLHLTDDQGWRLEIKKYPKLSSIASHFDERFGGGGGYYTQDHMRALIAYARERNVTIVPEVELPGHSLEVLTAYPELLCQRRNAPVLEIPPFFYGPRGFADPVCAGNERSYQFFQDILSEVMDLFPGEFIHLGGDEVPKAAWKECARCQARMKAEGLTDENELQSYFTKRMVSFIVAKGRRAIGWDEILEGGLAPGAAVMSWRGTKGGIAAADLGHDVVMTPNTNCYLDYTHLRLPVEQAYSYEPIPAEFKSILGPHLLGVQASMWTHIATTERAIDYQIYPRALALAEVGWSPARARNWSDFADRLRFQNSRLRSLGIHGYDADEYGRARQVGAWNPAEIEGNSPHVLEWDVSSITTRTGEYQVQVRRDTGRKTVFVRSLVLLEDGREISRETLPGPLQPSHSIEIGWLKLSRLQPGARYTLRVGIRGTQDNDVAGSGWMVCPPDGSVAARE